MVTDLVVFAALLPTTTVALLTSTDDEPSDAEPGLCAVEASWPMWESPLR